MIKWIVTDMDGTLLQPDNTLTTATKEALLRCQRKGMRLVLASGRSCHRLFSYARELQMERYHGLLIEVNGMAMYDLHQHKRWIYRRLQHKEIAEIYSFVQALPVEIQGFLDDTLYDQIPKELYVWKQKEREKRKLPQDYPWTGGAWSWVNDSRDGYPHIHYVNALSQFPQELNKFNLIQEPDVIDTCYIQMKQQFLDAYEIVRTSPRLLEITAKGVTKGNMLRRLMEREQLQPEEIIAFGDGENDVDMFDQVAYGIAMGNAAAYVKERAYGITGANTEEGIASLLNSEDLLAAIHNCRKK